MQIWSLGSKEKDPILVLDLDSYGRSMVWNSDIKEEMHQKTFIAWLDCLVVFIQVFNWNLNCLFGSFESQKMQVLINFLITIFLVIGLYSAD